MSSRLTLTLPPGFADTEVEVDTRRFSIGRTPENDLVIEDPSLSRRHALIENFDGRYNLSDCGSSNGTLVNGRPVTGMIELADWDVLVFGGVGDIVVRIQDETERSRNTGRSSANVTTGKSPAAVFAQNVAHAPKPAVAVDQFWLSGPMIAAAAGVLILLITGLVLLAARGSKPPGVSKPAIVRKPEPINDNVNDDHGAGLPNESTPSPVVSDPVSVTPVDPGQVDLSIIEAYAGKVLTGISKDTHPVLTEKPLKE